MKRSFINSSHNKNFVIVFAIALFLPALSFCQVKRTGTIEYLKYTNGINGIRLGADISTLPTGKLDYLDGDSRMDADSCLKYEIRDTSILRMPNDLKLDLIGIRTYKNKIVNIYVFFKRSDAYKILSNFLNDYGIFNQRPYEYVDIYNWNTSTVNLSLMYEANTDLGVAIYTSNPIKQLIAENEAIADMRKKALAQKTAEKTKEAISSAQTKLANAQ